MRRAFTLLETLVVIAVVAVLIAITLPALARARVASSATRSSANARTLTSAVIAYCDDNRDLFPAVQPDVLYPFEEGGTLQFPYWQVDHTWIVVIFQQLARWQHMDVVYSPGSRVRVDEPLLWLSSYRYTWSMVAHPGHWRRNSQHDESLVTAQRLSSVAFPSRKAVLWDDEAAWLGSKRSRLGQDLRQGVPVALVDNSVGLRSPAGATEPVVNPARPDTPAMRLRSTENGCAGVDFD